MKKNRLLLKIALTFSAIFSFSNMLWSQKAPDIEISKHRFEIISGIGDQVIFDASYDYEVHLFQLEYSYTFAQKEKWNWEAVLQPQYNLSRFTKVGEDFSELIDAKEFGLSGGLLARTRLLKDIIGFYSVIGAGPHYISDSPRRQAKGFIFSTFLNFGFTLKLINNAYFDLRPGFRHISNAGTKKPNMGLNTFTLSAGLMIGI
ncbi:acyloxyacyl hydrolase [Sunxiuqinia sp. A32]|uniref:acyloxyacyl hydrolase n=1 Tax=Sunxiuqinia sp. A32 TaxID=3461496 RepID=UPI00404650BF